MKVYAKIYNEKTKAVCVGFGSDAKAYNAQGFTIMDVEQGWDGNWYVAGHVPPKSKTQLLREAKQVRETAVSEITVTVDGMVFDGDEKAQERMARAVLLADSPEEQTEWVLADSTVAIVTAAQLRRACKLAGKNQTVLWVKPYEA